MLFEIGKYLHCNPLSKLVAREVKDSRKLVVDITAPTLMQFPKESQILSDFIHGEIIRPVIINTQRRII